MDEGPSSSTAQLVPPCALYSLVCRATSPSLSSPDFSTACSMVRSARPRWHLDQLQPLGQTAPFNSFTSRKHWSCKNLHCRVHRLDQSSQGLCHPRPHGGDWNSSWRLLWGLARSAAHQLSLPLLFRWPLGRPPLLARQSTCSDHVHSFCHSRLFLPRGECGPIEARIDPQVVREL